MGKIIQNEIKRVIREFKNLLLVVFVTAVISFIGFIYYDKVEKNVFLSAIWIFSIIIFMFTFVGLFIKNNQLKNLRQYKDQF